MKKETVDRDQAFREVVSIIRRAALIHYHYAKTVIDELGKEKGEKLVLKAIRAYGAAVGSKVREQALAKGLDLALENYQEDLPSLGWEIEPVLVDGEPRARVRECHLAKVWQEQGEPAIGRLYCHMDQAKFTAYNPDLECVHEKNVLDGDPYCELAVRSKAAQQTK
jgi:predicted ArsR family transcriptional regulator